jgi:hypothetical protein
MRIKMPYYYKLEQRTILQKRWGINFKASLPIRINGLSWTLAARLIYMIK